MHDSKYKNADQKEDKDCAEKTDDMASDRLLKTRQILLSGEINKALAEKVIRQALVLEAESLEPLYVYIDSPGGDADAGFAIFDMLRFIAAPVYTVGMGLAASAAAIVLLSAPKERRLGLPNSHYLIHQPLSGINGVATEIEIHAQELEKMKKRINELISKECSQPIDRVEKDTDRDYWLNAAEAREYGLISDVIASRDRLPLK